MGDTIEKYTINIDDNEFTVEIHPDYDMGLPWEDIEECRKWLNGDKFWVYVYVECCDYSDSLGGIEATYSDNLQYAKEHAQEIAQTLNNQIKKERGEVDYWASRDVCTV